MASKFGKILIAMGVLCLVGALAFTLANVRDERQAEATVIEQSAVLQAMIETKPPEEQLIIPPEQVIMPTIANEDYTYVGILDIPALGLTLPVQSQWSEELLKQTPCLYKGTLSDGLIIAGHNYKAHFEPLLQVVPGDEVVFTDVEGNVWHYQVQVTEIIGGNDVDSMVAGDWDLTLFTCTYGAKDRFTVRCNLK